jgi:hypothetical protein
MKRRSFLAPLTAFAVSACFFSTGQVSAQQVRSRQATADSPRSAPAVTIAAVADAAKLREVYGFAARLPKDVESFSASYRLHDLWSGLANSKWATTLMSLPPVKEERDIQRMIAQWNSPEAEQIKGLLEAVLGQEFVIATPAGFSAKLQPLLAAYTQLFEVYMQRVFLSAMSGQRMNPRDVQDMMRDAAPELIPAFAKAEVPPVIIIAKAGKAKDIINAAFEKLMSLVGNELPPAFEPGQFKLADKYEFKSVSIIAKKLIAAFQEEQFRLQLRELLKDEAKAKEVLDLIMTKRAELAWGWVDDYFVISIGTDHSHLKLATGDADSALSIPEVAARAAQYADKKPLGLSYTSRTMFDSFSRKIEFADAFTTITEELRGILKPEAITGMRADVKKLEARAQSLFNSTYDAEVDVGWWEGGLHGETFGGLRNTMIDSSKPLAFSALAGPATFLLLDGRSSANSKLAVDFVEEAAGTLWSWYEKYGRTMVPESERQGAAMMEATVLPLVKQAWNSARALGKALGDESALVLDLNGDMPKLPKIPPFLADGKIPRIAWVSELKDRAALSESWKGFSSIIKQISALLAESAPQTIPEPQMKKDGDVEIHFVPLPKDTGDLLPHIAISKDRWILSTSPSFSKEIAAKPAGTGAPAGSEARVNFTALWDLADKWLVIVDKNAEQMLGPGDSREFKQFRPLIGTGLSLARSLQGIEARIFEEGGKTRSSIHLKIQDLK